MLQDEPQEIKVLRRAFREAYPPYLLARKSLERKNSEVREQLGLVHGAQNLDRLDLQDQFMRNHDIRPEPGFQEHSTVNNRHRNLTPEFKCGFRQLEAKAFLVHRLEQPGTELHVHSNSQPNDTFGQCIAGQHDVSLWLSVILGVLCVEP